MNSIKWLNESIEAKYFLKEAKQDKEEFIKFAGDEELVNKFEKYKKDGKITGNQRDYGWWVKNSTRKELEKTIHKIETDKTKTQLKKELFDTCVEGKDYRVVFDADGWRVIEILSTIAAQKYGKGTKWCITGNNPDVAEGETADDWFAYYEDNEGVGGYYFIIPSSGKNKKWCYLDYGKCDWLTERDDIFYDASDEAYDIQDLQFIMYGIPRKLFYCLPTLSDYLKEVDSNSKKIYDDGKYQVIRTTGYEATAFYNDKGPLSDGKFLTEQDYEDNFEQGWNGENTRVESFYFVLKSGATHPESCLFGYEDADALENGLTEIAEIHSRTWLVKNDSSACAMSQLDDLVKQIPISILELVPHLKPYLKKYMV